MKEFFYKIVNIILKKFKKKILIIKDNFESHNGRFAVKSKFGFWYIGDIFNRADISHGIAHNGLVEKEETELVNKILNLLLKNKEKVVFYDIGANTGYYGVLASFLGKGRVVTYSFEPIKEHLEILRENININKLENIIKIFPIALGNKNGVEIIHLAGSGSTIIPEIALNENNKKREIEIKKLDSLFEDSMIEIPDFVKMDVEGAEHLVFKGGEKNIKQYKPVFFVEIINSLKNTKMKQNYEKNAFLEYLTANLNYDVYCLDDEKLIKIEKKCLLGTKMYLCLDKDKHNYLKKELCL